MKNIGEAVICSDDSAMPIPVMWTKICFRSNFKNQFICQGMKTQPTVQPKGRRKFSSSAGSFQDVGPVYTMPFSFHIGLVSCHFQSVFI